MATRSDDASDLPLWARDERDTRDRADLTRERIVAAAIEIADRDGLGAVSMRNLGGALDARVMSLYRHVSGKDDLLDLMFDELSRRTLLGDDVPPAWPDALRAVAHRIRRLGTAHPWSVEILAARAQIGPHTLRLLDEWMAVAAPLGLPPRETWAVVTAVNNYVTGYVVRAAAVHRVVPRDRDAAARWQAGVGAYLTRTADSGAVPHLAPLLRDGFAAHEDDHFDAGLDRLLDGIAAAHSPHTRPDRPARPDPHRTGLVAESGKSDIDGAARGRR